MFYKAPIKYFKITDRGLLVKYKGGHTERIKGKVDLKDFYDKQRKTLTKGRVKYELNRRLKKI